MRYASSAVRSGLLKLQASTKFLLREAATDALRLLLLEANGYSVSALELIDPDETPKNILLRGILRKGFDPASPEALQKRAEYARIKGFLIQEPGV